MNHLLDVISTGKFLLTQKPLPRLGDIKYRTLGGGVAGKKKATHFSTRPQTNPEIYTALKQQPRYTIM